MALAVAGVLALVASDPGTAQVVDPGLAPYLNDTVRAVAVQDDGRLLIGGQFTQVDGQPRPYLARLAADGTLAAALAFPDDQVNALAVLADGHILIAGDFRNVAGAAHHYVARLRPDGQPDPGFQSGIGHTAGIRVARIAAQADGKVIVAGGFATVSGQPRPGLARLNADGTNDSSFTPPALGGQIDALALQADGRLVLAGNFDIFGEDCPSDCIARLDRHGAPDAGFQVVPVLGLVSHLAVQADDRILVGGEFGGLGSHDTFFVGRLGPDGGPDPGFTNTGMRYSHIHRIEPLPDGRVVIAGEIGWGSSGPTLDRVARLLPDGQRDLGFAEPLLDNQIIGSALQPDGQLLLGGMFTLVDGLPRTRLVRLQVADRPDPLFRNGFE